MNERRREALIIVLHNRTEFLRVVLANRDRELFLRSAGEKRGRKGKDRGERVAVNLRGRDCFPRNEIDTVVSPVVNDANHGGINAVQ